MNTRIAVRINARLEELSKVEAIIENLYEEGKLPVLTLDPAYEKLLSQVEEGGLAPDVINKLVKSLTFLLKGSFWQLIDSLEWN